MCLICIEFKAGKLTVNEAFRNYDEMKETIEEDHKLEVDQMLFEGLWKEYYDQYEMSSEDDYWEETGFGD